MALLHGGALAASLGDFGGFFAPTLTSRVDHVSYPQLVARNDSSVGNNTNADTVNLFIDSIVPDASYAASIVEACQDATVYAFQCTAAAASVTVSGLVIDSGCGKGDVYTVTDGPSTYIFTDVVSTSTRGHNLVQTAVEHCSLAGTTAAVCRGTVTLAVDATSTQTTITTTVSGTDYHRFDVAITAGAEKTANPTGTCIKASSGVTTKSLAVWALTAIVGVTGILVAA